MAQWIDNNFKRIALLLWGLLWVIYVGFMIFMFISLPLISMLVVLGVLDIPYLVLATIMLIMISTEVEDEFKENKALAAYLIVPYAIVFVITVGCLGWLLLGSI